MMQNVSLYRNIRAS